MTSDTISCELSDGNPFAAIPRKGDTITASLGYLETGLAFFGSYTADDPEVRCLPYGMTVNGKGANVRDQAKQHRSRHWDKKTVKDIISEIASENGLSAIVDDEIGAHEYDWFGQQDESDLHVVERLARRHGALFSIKDGKLIFAAKGSGKSASGKGLTAVVASPANIVEGTCRTNFAHRNRFGKVKARHHDRDEAELIEVEAESDEGGRRTTRWPSPSPTKRRREGRRQPRLGISNPRPSGPPSRCSATRPFEPARRSDTQVSGPSSTRSSSSSSRRRM
ncbi:phage late control D family protein [Kaistia adipata]|uniref:phage late control D family protein n=1 Tax=Kaistia adipata TaxID=166954 RepID=UPI001FE1B539|nr:contractile injection system protein, VgrG/Pvc8 family [Kaistia adipata]